MCFRIILKFLRYCYRKVFRPLSNYGLSYHGAIYIGQDASDLIKYKLLQTEPTMICRFGSVELNAVLNFMHQQKTLKNYYRFITGQISTLWWEKHTFHDIYNNAGIFPANEETISDFARLMLTDMKYVDILGSWKLEEQFLRKELTGATKIRLPDLEPYYHQHPWSEALKHKTVLVIHPFTKSIEAQLQKRKQLFADQRVLPEFKLKTLKSVQSIAGNKTRFKDWFCALDYMKNQIDNIQFDIAILGCGAYGFPLAAHIKRIGKKAVHLGGATQVLFGIIGKRWEEHEFISTLFNKHWIRPHSSEIPNDFSKVESGCYW